MTEELDEILPDTEEDLTTDFSIYTDEYRERFAKKYRKNKDGCWIWQGKRDSDGYGGVRVGLKFKRAHRVSYEMETGEDITGLDIDHLCHIRACVNPAHLEAVTHKENMQRLRKAESWEISEDEFKKKTTAEKVIDEALAIIERSNVVRPELTGFSSEKGYPVAAAKQPFWRRMSIEDGRIAQDKFALVSLFLLAVSMGANWKEASLKILDLSPYAIEHWSSANNDFREDLNAARKAGRRRKYDHLEDMHLDEMEKKIEYADFKDVANSLAKLREQDEDRIALKQKNAAANVPHISISFANAPEQTLRNVLVASEIIEASFKELPMPIEEDEDGEES